MYQFKGFVEIDTQLGSPSGVIRPIGDLSTKALTFSRQVPSYASATHQLFTLHSFKSASEVAKTAAPVALRDQIFRIVNWLYTAQKSVNATTSVSATIAALNQQFLSEAVNFGCGVLVNDGGLSFPTYLSWVNQTLVTNSPTIGGEVKIWFSDSAFQIEYDEYEIIVVPPLPDIDTFFNGSIAVDSALKAYRRTTQINDIQNARGDSPETIIAAHEYSYVDPLSTSTRISTTWTVLIYGAAGDTVDNIRTAIQRYISENTEQTQSRWGSLFPEIYTSVDFYIFPRWRNIAIPAMSLNSGAYSSIVEPNKEVNYIVNAMPNLTRAHVQATLRVFPTNYNSLMIAALSDEANVSSQKHLEVIFPDLINLPYSDPMFNMMSAKTQGWVLFLQNVIALAERASPSTTLPAGISRVTINSILFLSQEYQGVNYLVATKLTTPSYD